MEKQDVEEGKMDNADDDNQLLQREKVIWLSIFPARVWLNVTDILADCCTDDLKNLCNTSPFFRDLMLSKRVLFLFPEVLKIIGPILENAERVSEEEKSSILSCRAACKTWNKAVDHYINASVKPDFFQAPPYRQPRDPAMITARYKYFGFMAPHRLQQFLKFFDQSLQTDSVPRRNPLIGTTVALCNDSRTSFCNPFALRQQHCENVVTLLSKYGQYIRVMSLGVLPPTSDELQDYLWLKECLELVPNLTHLKVKQKFEGQNPSDHLTVDKAFGEHAYRTEPSTEYLRRRILNEMGAFSAEVRQQIHSRVINICAGVLETIRLGERKEYNLDEWMINLIETIADAQGYRIIHAQGNPIARLTDKEYWTAIAENPLPVLKNLECLKLCKVSARVFNPLIQSNRQITWLHIEPRSRQSRMPNYVEWWTLDFPNLKQLYIKFTGGPEEVRRLRDFHPSFMKLTSLHFGYPFENKYMGWAEIFMILEQNWGDTLTELKIRLPHPKSEKDKENVKNACENCRLALPKLKRLVMLSMSYQHEEEVDMHHFQFLNSIRENLEEFVVL